MKSLNICGLNFFLGWVIYLCGLAVIIFIVANTVEAFNPAPYLAEDIVITNCEMYRSSDYTGSIPNYCFSRPDCVISKIDLETGQVYERLCDEPEPQPESEPDPEPICEYNELRIFYQHRNDGGRLFNGTRMFFTGTPEDHRRDKLHTDDPRADEIEFLPCMQAAIQNGLTRGGLTDSGHAQLQANHNDRIKNADAYIYHSIMDTLGLRQAGWCSAEEIAAGKNGVSCLELKSLYSGPARMKKAYWTEPFYMDQNCQLVKDVPQEEICEEAVSIGVIGSPISLLLDDSVDIEEEATIVSFPIDPNKAGVYSWKASAKAPLLVFDPLGTNKVSSAQQLFGDWTFGGKLLASTEKSISDVEPRTGAKWSNGYEALATLDTNSDGEIKGVELKDLALWFDQNRNGVSEDGEVRKLASVGITKLFYTPDSRNGLTKSIHASKGFERVVDGKTTHGRSVDWYGEHATSAEELIRRKAARNSLAAEAKTSQEVGDELAEVPEASTDDNLELLRGAWLWSVVEPGKSGISKGALGYFVFAKLEGEKSLRGLSIVEKGLRKNKSLKQAKLKSKVHVFPLENIEPIANSWVSFQYILADGSRVTSKATVSEGRLSGTSTYHMKGEPDLTYRWQAERIEI